MSVVISNDKNLNGAVAARYGADLIAKAIKANGKVRACWIVMIDTTSVFLHLVDFYFLLSFSIKTSNPALLGKPLLQANVILATGASQFEVSKKGKRKSKRKEKGLCKIEME